MNLRYSCEKKTFLHHLRAIAISLVTEAVNDPANLFQEDENRSESAAPREVEYDDDNEDLESDADDFIVDDDGRPIAERKKKRKPIFTDA